VVCVEGCGLPSWLADCRQQQTPEGAAAGSRVHSAWHLSLPQPNSFSMNEAGMHQAPPPVPLPPPQPWPTHTCPPTLQFRGKAHQLGIPFASMWDGSAPELQRSLLPVFVLYAGLATPREVALPAAPFQQPRKGGRGPKGARRIRLE